MEKNSLEIFKKRVDRCIENSIKNLKYLYQCRSDEKTYSIDYYEFILDELEESVKLLLEFNQLKEKIGKVTAYGVIKDLKSYPLGKTVQNIRTVLRELQTVKDYLESYLKPKLSEFEKSKIDPLRDELENLKKRNCDLLILQNLEEALSEGESTHYLACGIISARVIDYIIHFIKKEENIPSENLNENIIKKLRELGILEEDKIAGQDKKEFLDAAKSSRDAVIHKIEFMPNGPKAISLLSYAFMISDLLIKYKESKIKKENATVDRKT